MDALSAENLTGSIEALTEAIKVGASAPLYAQRASIYLRLKKPNAAIRDCDAAVQLNPDSSKAYKMRGRANRMLGEWAKAAADLRLGNRLDYDDSTYELQKLVEEKLQKVNEKQKKRDEAKKKKHASHSSHSHEHDHSHCQGHDHGHGGIPAGGNPFEGIPQGGIPTGAGIPPQFMQEIFSDPELVAAIQDPSIANILLEINQNPAAIEKYKDNPKFAAILKKLQGAFSK